MQQHIMARHLLIAVREGRESIVLLLISRGADVNLRTVDGQTALCYEEGNDDRSMANILRKNGAQ
jgi:ankyrin repeat protein